MAITFHANKSGNCATCGGPIQPGNLVHYWGRTSAHVYCTRPGHSDSDTYRVDWQDDAGQWQPHSSRHCPGAAFSRPEANGAALCLSRHGYRARITQGGRLVAVFAAHDPILTLTTQGDD